MISIEEAARILREELEEQSSPREKALSSVLHHAEAYRQSIEKTLIGCLISKMRGEVPDKTSLDEIAMNLHIATERLLELESGEAPALEKSQANDGQAPEDDAEAPSEYVERDAPEPTASSNAEISHLAELTVKRPLILYGAAQGAIPQEKRAFLRKAGMNFDWIETRALPSFVSRIKKGPSAYVGALIFSGQMNHSSYDAARSACQSAKVPYRICERIGQGQITQALLELHRDLYEP